MSRPLLNSTKIGDLNLKNRVIMAPLTRCRATVDHLATDLMATYYAQRASAGLIIAEATMAMEGNSAFYREPGIYSPAHANAWKKVTDAVHAKGGLIFLQVWHGGRACHPVLNNGAIPVAPSAIAIDSEVHTPQGKVRHVTPRALEDAEIPGIIEGFKSAFLHAKAAGFDGVEVHGANGYLLDEFLRDGSNKRTGPYGGSIENRARLLLEVVQEAIKIWGAGRVGVRISPLNSYNSMFDSDPIGLTRYVGKKLSELNIAYLHVMRADFFGMQKGDVMSAARDAFPGCLVGNMGYTPGEAEDAMASRKIDAVAFGHHFISNPNLVEKVAKGLTLSEPDQATFYTHDGKGYIDYI